MFLCILAVLPLEMQIRIYVASILCLASVVVGPPTEPDTTTTEFRTSRCKLHQNDIHYEICEWDMHRLLCQYWESESSQGTGRQPCMIQSWQMVSILNLWCSIQVGSCRLAKPSLSTSLHQVLVATGLCTTNEWFLASFVPFIFPLCVSCSPPSWRAICKRQPFMDQTKIMVWPAGQGQQLRTEQARVCFASNNKGISYEALFRWQILASKVL